MKLIKLLLLACTLQTLTAQNPPLATPAADRFKAYEQRLKMSENSLVRGVPFRNIGPWVQSGRVVDVDVNPRDPSVYYVCYASGGLWKTTSNGSEFTPIFDRQAVITTGDVAVNWDKNIIWLGTGENNAQRSSYAGTGVYKSTDDGKTWQHVGLSESHHIGRIALHPTNPDVVWVAALGHLYSPNPERGIYKTTDGGKSWRKTLFVDDNTGGIEIVCDNDNPNILYAAMWQKERRAWNFEENGEGSAIYKSINGGDTWTKISGGSSGFPQGAKIGRIGLEWAKQGNKKIIYAVVDNHNELPEDKKEQPALTKEMLKTMTKAAFLALEPTVIADFLRDNRFPAKYKATDIIERVKSDKITPQTLFDYVDSGDDGFGGAPLVQAEVYRSDDEGKTWRKTHDQPINDLFFTYGYVFSQIRVQPKNPDHVYILGTRIIKSEDGGKTWKSINRENVHWDHHALWVNPNRAGHLINGNDGGMNVSYDDGKTWFKLNSPSVGQFYHINVDMAEPYNVYGGLQDNGVWYGPSTAEFSNDWQDTGENPFKAIAGGDGMQTMIDTRDNATVYTGSQFGFYQRINTKVRRGGKLITPRHDLGEKPLRFNWMSPIWLSVHNQDVLYFGANKLYRSFDKGDTWEAISDDLTKGAKKGNVPYATLTTIHESPLKFGLLYVGTDDGLIHVSKDGGVSWKKISDNLPQMLWVSRVQASSHDRATVYATLTGYRWDDCTPYIYVSKNYGDTWERIGLDLPMESVNVIKEDPKNPNILYVGTEHNIYISLDKGKTFMAMDNGFPHAPVHDLVIHPRDNELVVGTHGRSIYIANVEHIQQLTADNLNKNLLVFDPKKIKNTGWGRRFDRWTEVREPKFSLPLYAKSSGTVKITVKAGKDIVLSQNTVQILRGVNYVDGSVVFNEKVKESYQNWLNGMIKEKDAPRFDLKKSDNGRWYLQKGKYTIEIEKDGEKVEKELVIE